MSTLTAKLKCLHGTGEDTHGAEAVTEGASGEDGGVLHLYFCYRPLRFASLLKNKHLSFQGNP